MGVHHEGRGGYRHPIGPSAAPPPVVIGGARVTAPLAPALDEDQERGSRVLDLDGSSALRLGRRTQVAGPGEAAWAGLPARTRWQAPDGPWTACGARVRCALPCRDPAIDGTAFDAPRRWDIARIPARGELVFHSVLFHSGAEQQVPGVMAAALPRRVALRRRRGVDPRRSRRSWSQPSRLRAQDMASAACLGSSSTRLRPARMSRIDAGAVSAARRAAAHQRGALARGQTRRA
jgi:hypothetical protein